MFCSPIVCYQNSSCISLELDALSSTINASPSNEFEDIKQSIATASVNDTEQNNK
jgi:hypothetical protein